MLIYLILMIFFLVCGIQLLRGKFQWLIPEESEKNQQGRLGKKVYEILEKNGYGCPEILEDNRKLIFENEENGVRYFWVKPSDVAIYVERGAADIGVAGGASDGALLFRKGEPVGKVPFDKVYEVLLDEVKKLP